MTDRQLIASIVAPLIVGGLIGALARPVARCASLPWASRAAVIVGALIASHVAGEWAQRECARHVG